MGRGKSGSTKPGGILPAHHAATTVVNLSLTKSANLHPKCQPALGTSQTQGSGPTAEPRLTAERVGPA